MVTLGTVDILMIDHGEGKGKMLSQFLSCSGGRGASGAKLIDWKFLIIYKVIAQQLNDVATGKDMVGDVDDKDMVPGNAKVIDVDETIAAKPKVKQTYTRGKAGAHREMAKTIKEDAENMDFARDDKNKDDAKSTA